MTRRARMLLALALTALATPFATRSALADTPAQLPFETHAAFFAGVRNAHLSDAPSTPLHSARLP